jgi:hypothetical protein
VKGSTALLEIPSNGQIVNQNACLDTEALVASIDEEIARLEEASRVVLTGDAPACRGAKPGPKPGRKPKAGKRTLSHEARQRLRLLKRRGGRRRRGHNGVIVLRKIDLSHACPDLPPRHQIADTIRRPIGERNRRPGHAFSRWWTPMSKTGM